MFDLFRSREKTQRYVLGGLLTLVAVSLVVTLPGVGLGGTSTRPDVVAEIGGEALTMTDVALNMQAALRQQNLPQDVAAMFVPQYVNQMISERALAYEAERLGFVVTDEDVARTIRGMQVFFPNGEFVGREAYEAFLNQNNLTVQKFESNVRQQILLTRLRNVVAEGTIVTPQEVEREFRKANDQVKLEYVTVSGAALRSQVNPTPDELQKHYNQNRSSYTIPEKRDFTLLVVDGARLGEVTVSDAELQRAYQDQIESFKTKDRVKVSHILLKTQDRPKEVADSLRKKAEELLAQVKGGADFAALAQKVSEDPVSAAKGGDLGFIERGATVPEFEQAAFALKPGEISGIVQSQYGYHIIKAFEKETARTRPLDEVRAELTTRLRQQSATERLQPLAERARAELLKSPNNPDAVAKQLGLPAPVRVQNAGNGDPVQEVGVSAPLEQALAGVKAGGVTGVVEVSPTKKVVAVVNKVTPSRPAQFAEVEAQVRQAVVDRKVRELVDSRSQELVSKAKASGDLAAAAKELGLEVKTSALLTRSGNIDGLGPVSLFGDGITQKVGSILGPVSQPDQAIVARIAEAVPADAARLAQQRADLLNSIKGRKARERNELFEDGVVARLTREGKIKLNQQNLQRLQANMRG